MRLKSARVQNYRSIRDTGLFEVERDKTIFVGPNEAGKTAVLQALQQIKAPKGVKGFDALRDYPRAIYNDITTGKAQPSLVPVVTAVFELDGDEHDGVPQQYRNVGYAFTRYLDNSSTHHLMGGPSLPTYGAIEKDLARLAVHIDGRTAVADGQPPSTAHAAKIQKLVQGWSRSTILYADVTEGLRAWLDSAVTLIDDSDATQDERLDRLRELASAGLDYKEAVDFLHARLPVFVLFSNYFRVRPLIHLAHLAQRLATNILDDDQ